MKETVKSKTKQNKKNEELKRVQKYDFYADKIMKIVDQWRCVCFASENDNHCGWDVFYYPFVIIKLWVCEDDTYGERESESECD